MSTNLPIGISELSSGEVVIYPNNTEKAMIKLIFTMKGFQDEVRKLQNTSKWTYGSTLSSPLGASWIDTPSLEKYVVSPELGELVMLLRQKSQYLENPSKQNTEDSIKFDSLRQAVSSTWTLLISTALPNSWIWKTLASFIPPETRAWLVEQWVRSKLQVVWEAFKNSWDILNMEHRELAIAIQNAESIFDIIPIATVVWKEVLTNCHIGKSLNPDIK